jgi:hypothetical protein
MHVRDTLEIQHVEVGVETADRHGATSHGRGRRGLGGERKTHTDTKNNATTRMHKCKSCSESVMLRFSGDLTRQLQGQPRAPQSRCLQSVRQTTLVCCLRGNQSSSMSDNETYNCLSCPQIQTYALVVCRCALQGVP